jgi:hypothetical protein
MSPGSGPSNQELAAKRPRISNRAERSVGVVSVPNAALVSPRVRDSEQHKRNAYSQDDDRYQSLVTPPLSEALSRHLHHASLGARGKEGY